MTQTFAPVPTMFENEIEHRRQMAVKINTLNQAKFNCSLEVTLMPSSTTTTVNDVRISPFSILLLMPTTLHAAQEIAGGGLYIAEATMLNSSAVITHANNAQTDRTFRMGIFG